MVLLNFLCERVVHDVAVTDLFNSSAVWEEERTDFSTFYSAR